MNTLTKAAVFALGAAVVSGVNGFLTKSALSAVGDPVVFTFLKNMVVVIALLLVFLVAGKFREVREASGREKWMLVAIGIVGGGVPFLLYFIGLSMVQAVTAAFIHKTLFVWVAMLAVPFLGERVGWLHAFSFALLLLAVFVFQSPLFRTFGTGELLIFLATLLWAVENIIAKKVMKRLSSLTAMTARMGIGSVVIFAFVVFGGKFDALGSLSLLAWGWVVVTGILLAGFVSLWYRALSLAPATFVTCLLIPATFITGALSSLLVTHTVSGAQVVGWICLVAGIALLFLGSFFAAPKRQLRSVTADSLG